MKTIKTWFVAFLVVGGMFVCASSGHTATITFENFSTFSGYPLSGVLRATITDIEGGVRLTMEATNVSSATKIGTWYFNTTGTITGFNYVSGAQASATDFVAYTSELKDKFKADGDGYYNVVFDWPTSSGTAFFGGTIVVYELLGVTASSFAAMSQGGDKGAFYSAAHIQPPPGTDSSWVGTRDKRVTVSPVPVPPTVWLLGTGLLGLIGIRRRFSKK